MATPMADILSLVRVRLREISPRAWTDQDLLDIANGGIKDLWRRICDAHQNHFFTINDTDVTYQANDDELTGIPDDCYRVVAIRPKTLGESSSNRSLIFKPANGVNDPRYVQAEARAAVAPENAVIYYVVVNEGAPVGTPRILCAPPVTSAVNIHLKYNQVLQKVDEDDVNPIPGESDNALVAWTVAYARADERDDKAPDPEWLAVYATEKTNIIKEIGPRQVQEPQVVEGMFEDYDDAM
jgi:hypothetical protein